MGSKGDVEISGTGGGEPRDDYSPMSTVLPTDFPVFDDGAGEIEEIPGGLPIDGASGLYYFQSSYDFFQFPGEDGFFGFSNDVTYQHSQITPDLVVQPGDYWISIDESRVYSFSDNLADSYMHLCERDLEITGDGAITIWPSKTVRTLRKWTPVELNDMISPDWDDLPGTWILPWYRFRLQYARPSRPHHLYAYWRRWQSSPLSPSVEAELTVYSKDGGETWHVPTGDLARSIYDPGGADVLREQVFTVQGTGNTWSHNNTIFVSSNDRVSYTTDLDSFTYKWITAPPFWMTWGYQGFGSPNNRDHFKVGDMVTGNNVVVLYTVGAEQPGQSQDWHLSLMDTAAGYSPALVDFEPTGPGVCEFDGYRSRVGWLKHGRIKGLPFGFNHDYFFLAIDSGHSYTPYSVWNDTSWKSRVAYYEIDEVGGTLSSRGIGWQASSEPDADAFETIIHFDVQHIILEAVVNGSDKFKFPVPWFIARYCMNGPGKGPYAWQYPGFGSFNNRNWSYEYRVYASTDLGQSYDLVQTLDKLPVPYETDDINMQFHADRTLIAGVGFEETYNYGTANAPRIIVPLYARDYAASPSGAETLITYAYFNGLTFEGGLCSTQQWPPLGPLPYEVFHYGFEPDGIPWTDMTPNLYMGAEHVKWFGPFNGDGSQGGQGTIMAGGSLLQFGHRFEERPTQAGAGSVWPPPEGEYITMIDYSEPQYDNYIYDRVVCDSAGFTIRAPHINELRQKLLQLNSTVQTGGTNRVSFGIDVSDLPTVSENKTEVRANHYEICKREHDVIAGQVGVAPGVAFWNEGESLVDIMAEAPTPVADGTTAPSIRTLIAMRKVLQELYANGWYCSCYSYCPCQTFVDITIEGGKK